MNDINGFKFSEGDLVLWYEYYACGSIVREAGTGVIVEGYQHAGFNRYQVLIEKESIRTFSEWELETYEDYMQRKEQLKAGSDSGAEELFHQ